MPKLNEMYPSKYLKAGDFTETGQALTIKHLEEDNVGQGKDAKDVWVIFFKEVEKGLILNKTNSGIIGKLYGEDTDDWIGKRVTLYATEVQFGNEMVEAIRIRTKIPKGAANGKPETAKAAKAPAAPAREPGDDDDDEAPY